MSLRVAFDHGGFTLGCAITPVIAISRINPFEHCTLYVNRLTTIYILLASDLIA